MSTLEKISIVYPRQQTFRRLLTRVSQKSLLYKVVQKGFNHGFAESIQGFAGLYARGLITSIPM